MVPAIPSLEKEDGKPGRSLMERPGCEATGRQEREKFKHNLPFPFPAGLYPQNIPIQSRACGSLLIFAIKSQNLGGNGGPGRESYSLKITRE